MLFRKTKRLIGITFLAAAASAFAQNETALDGYVLYSVWGMGMGGGTTTNRSLLINNNKETVHTWNHSAAGGYCSYLLPNGNLLRPQSGGTSSRNVAGGTGTIQVQNKSGAVVWEYTHNRGTDKMHHDVEPLPNGNVLAIISMAKTNAEATAAGFTGLTRGVDVDYIIEVAPPSGGQPARVVWEWHIWDHLVSGNDASRRPERFSTSMRGSSTGGGIGGGGLDWTHVNGIGYSTTLDQIVFTLRYLNEVIVIDHSTTTEQAKGSTGGRYGKGGDILYRWGNPANYGASGTKQFSIVHSAHFIPVGYPGAGNLLALNNSTDTRASKPIEWTAPHNNGNYTIPTAGQAFGPAQPTWTYSGNSFYSDGQGCVQRLPNGNTLCVSSSQNSFFEVSSRGTVVWPTYRPANTTISRAQKYSKDYPGIRVVVFNENPSSSNVPAHALSMKKGTPLISLTNKSLTVSAPSALTVDVFALNGRKVFSIAEQSGSVKISPADLRKGTYVVKASSMNVQTMKTVSFR